MENTGAGTKELTVEAREKETAEKKEELPRKFTGKGRAEAFADLNKFL